MQEYSPDQTRSNFKLQIFQPSSDEDLIVHLISKELHDARLQSMLEGVGFNCDLLSSDLGVAILSLMGCWDRTDDLWNWYYRTVEEFSVKVDLQDGENTRRLALEFYKTVKGQLK